MRFCKTIWIGSKLSLTPDKQANGFTAGEKQVYNCPI